MATMKTIETGLREAGIDPERWQEAIDVAPDTKYVDYALACDVADVLANLDLYEEVLEVARERWPLTD